MRVSVFKNWALIALLAGTSWVSPARMALADTQQVQCAVDQVRSGLLPRTSRVSLEAFLGMLHDPSDQMRNTHWSSRKTGPMDPIYTYLNAAMDLHEGERAKALAALPSSPLTKDVKTLISVALYDENAWLSGMRWADLAYAPFDREIVIKGPWMKLIKNMPPTLKSKLDALVNADYLSAPKSNREGNSIVDRPYATAGQKRGMDAYLRLTGDPSGEFLGLVEKGTPPLEAYTRVLKEQREKYFKGTPVGDYDPEISFQIAKAVQRVIRRSGLFGKGEHVSLPGSFVNGKAVITRSDIDIWLEGADKSRSYFNPSAAEKDKALRLKELSRAIRAQVAAEFKSKRVLPPEVTPLREETLGVLNPFVIRIYRDRIELLVTPPKDERLRTPETIVIPVS